MNRTIILKKLRELGLSDYESKSYLSLMERDSLTVAEAAKIAGIPRQSAYEAMEKLMIKGLCRPKPGDTKKYSASDPDLFRENFSSQIDEEIDADSEDFAKREAAIIEKYESEKNKKLLELHEEKTQVAKQRQAAKESIVNVAKELKPFYEQSRSKSDPLDYIEVLKNPLQIHRKFIELFARAEKEVLVFCKPPFAYVSKKEMEEQWRVQIDATKKGVVVRGIFELPPEDKRKEFFTERDFKQEHTTGDELKFIDELPIKLNIFDNRACMFTVVDPIVNVTSLTMLVTEHEAIAKSFRMLFESVWEKASYHCIVDGREYSPLAKKENRNDDDKDN